MVELPSESSQTAPSEKGDPAWNAGNDLRSLRAARDAAVRAAQDAVYNTTRLTRLLTILSEPAPLEILLDRVLATLSELFSADVVVLLDPAGTGHFYPLAAIGLPEELLCRAFSDAESSYSAAVMRTGSPLLISAAGVDPHMEAQLHEMEVQNAVWLPVVGSVTPRGVLILARCRAAPFAHADVDLLAAMAHRIGLVLEQAQHSIQIEQILRTGREISRHLDETTVCTQAVQMFPRLIGAEATALVLKSSDGACRCVGQSGLDPAWGAIWCLLAKQLAHDANLACGEAYSTPDLHALDVFFRSDMLAGCPARALLAVPIRINEHMEGILFAMRFSLTPFSPDTLQIAMLYAGQAAAALENARLYRAVRDELAERNRVEQRLRAREERFSAMIRSVSDVIAILDSDGIVYYASPAVNDVWGCPAEILIGQTILDRVHPDDCSGMRALLSSVQEQSSLTLTHSLRMRQGMQDTWRVFEMILTNLLHEPAIGGIVATYHDITERKIYEQELTKLAYLDALTGLANRAYFVGKLRHALEHADSAGQSVALAFFDLDNFKVVNDSLGHDKGDEVLQIVADRVRDCLRREDTAARLGGDEFTVLIENVSHVQQVITIAHRLMAALRDPIHLNDRELFVSCSMGIAISTPFQDNPEDLLRKADLAMYEAKGKGKGCYAIFDIHMNATAMERLELETELRRALQRAELAVYYQPIISLEDNRIVEVEALIRWQHPTRGLVSPALIIPVAEETGLILEMGQWVLEESCRQVRDWQRRCPGAESLALSVNLSARQFQNARLLIDIRDALRESGLAPSSLILEITESSLIEDPDAMIAKLHALREIGVRIALDDFGTGYASLSYLKLFPVDVLKIDRSFVQGIVRDPRDKAIVQGMIDLAQAFGLEVVGEGIETEEQAAQMRSLRCSHGQGYLFAPALPAAEFEARFNHNP